MAMLARIKEFHKAQKIGPSILLASCVILLIFVIAIEVL